MWTSSGNFFGGRQQSGPSSWEVLYCMVPLGLYSGGRKQVFRLSGPISQISALPPSVGSHQEQGQISAS